MKKMLVSLLVCLTAATVFAGEIVDYLQDTSLTVRAGDSSGSGVLIAKGAVTYVLTAAHVVDGLRRVRQIIDPKTGASRSLVYFEPVEVVKFIVEDGVTVARIEAAAEVIRYSDAEFGEDLALLRVNKRNFSTVSAKFYVETNLVSLGTELIHVGSLLGEFGANSVTTGIYSAKGRLLFGKVFDQTSAAAFPGSSGGGVFLKDGRYVGMIVRGAGETYNLIVPIRRIATWAKRVKIEFILDASPVVSDSLAPLEDIVAP